MTALIKWKNHRIEDVEVNLLLQALNERYGYDFTGYARASLKRRLRDLISYFDLEHLTQLIPIMLYDEAVAQTVINSISVPTSEFFRNPFVWAYLRNNIMPMLASFPRINIWQAGCGFGQETYSLSILLHETGLIKRSHIFCTDINPAFLNEAQKGSWSMRHLSLWQRNYEKSGGQSNFTDFFIKNHNKFDIHSDYKKNIEFIQHNLVSDDVFKEVQFVICRNVLLYFDMALQNRVIDLFTRSLERSGYLLLGSGENILNLKEHYPQLQSLDYSLQFYQRQKITLPMYKMLVIGLSAGGMPLVKQLLMQLPPNYSLPVVIVVHLPQDYESHFDEVLKAVTNLPVSIARDKERILNNHVYIAPAGYHLLIEQNKHFALSTDKPVKSVRPSIDVLFSSAAEVFENDLIAVILSGANSDGADGMAIVKQLGGLCIVLNPLDAQFNTMPNAVINSVDVDYIASIEEILSLVTCVDETE